MKQSDKKRFWSKVNKNGPIHPVLKTKCWLWTAALLKGSGYGVFQYNGNIVVAHRFSFFLKHGRWPEPCGLHKCDVRACVREDHLFEGTKADNTADMMAKGRHRYKKLVNCGKPFPKGDEHWARKHPERVLRGDNHWTHKRPDHVARGDKHGRKTHPERWGKIGNRNSAQMASGAAVRRVESLSFG